MIKRASFHRVVFLSLFIVLTGSGLGLCRAQTAANAKEPAQTEIGLDVQAYILMASPDPVAKNKVPTTLENVIRQLGTTLGPNNFSLVATYVYRVNDGGALDVTGIGPWTTVNPAFAVRPAFYSFFMENVSIVNKGQPGIQIRRMKFGMSVPIFYKAQNPDTKDAVENVQYKDIGIVTQLNMTEGVPTIVGTLNTGQPDKMLILVLMVKRSQEK